MKQMLKKLTVAILAGCLSVLLLPAIPARASTDHTRAEAVSWANSKLGQALDYDGAYGAQCVDLIAYYYRYLGKSVPGGNANTYANGGAHCPSGWSYQNSPQPGDIAVWTSGTYGHVAIVVAVSGSKMQCVEQNYAGRMYCTSNFHNKDAATYIRPDFKSEEKKDETVRGSEMSSGAGKWIPDGDYEIVSAADRSYCLDIAGDAVPASAGCNVNLWERSSTPRVQDVFTVTYLNNGFYRIKQKNTDMSLDVDGASADQGRNVQMWGSNSSSAQQWSISPMSTGSKTNAFRIEAKCSGFSLDISGAALKNGTNVQQYSDNNSNAQAWIFVPYQPSQPIANGRYILTSALGSNLELDVAGDTGDISNGTNVQIWNDSCPSKYNSFDVTKLKNGYYKLKHVASGKALDSYGGVTTEGANIEVWEDNGSDAQQWAITRLGSGYVLRPRCSGMAMDAENGATDDGTNVRQWTYNGSKAQTWHFVQAEYSVRFDANGGSSAPASQTKYYKAALTLSKTVPTRSGYTFLGWSESKNATSATFKSGATYNTDADLTLYAVWKKNDTSSQKESAGTENGNADGNQSSSTPGGTQSGNTTGGSTSGNKNESITDGNTSGNQSSNTPDENATVGNTASDPENASVIPAKVTIKSAKNIKGKKITVKWEDTSYAAEYQVQISRSASFSTVKTYGTKTYMTEKRKYTMKKLKKNKIYSIRIRAISATGETGEWSETEMVCVRK